MDEEKFAQGFNYGYFLRDHKPELLDKLLKGMQDKDDLLEAISEGSKQRENELERERVRRSIERGNTHDKNNDRNLNR